MVSTLLQCPICKEPLILRGSSFVCANRHTFDLSRKRTVDLLGVKDRKLIGDSRLMLEARIRLHESGFFDPLKDEISTLIDQSVAPTETTRVDVGCGPGLFFEPLSKNAASETVLVGTDISPDALSIARRFSRTALLLRANSWRHIPLLSRSADLVFTAFAPSNPTECIRIMKRKAHRLIVTASTRHLGELRDVAPILSIHPGKERDIEDDYAGFRQILKRNLVYTFGASRQFCADVIQSGPSSFRKEAIDAVNNLPAHISITAAFLILLYQQP